MRVTVRESSLRPATAIAATTATNAPLLGARNCIAIAARPLTMMRLPADGTRDDEGECPQEDDGADPGCNAPDAEDVRDDCRRPVDHRKPAGNEQDSTDPRRDDRARGCHRRRLHVMRAECDGENGSASTVASSFAHSKQCSCLAYDSRAGCRPYGRSISRARSATTTVRATTIESAMRTKAAVQAAEPVIACWMENCAT